MDALATLLAALTCGEDRAAETAVPKLVHYGEQALPDLFRLLNTRGSGAEETDRRWWALRVLAEIDDRRVPACLAQSLADADPGVRQCAALGLRKQPDPLAIPALEATLDDPDPLCASLAADALTALGSAAVPTLLQVMEHGSRQARLEAARSLALIGDPRAIPALYNALDEDSALMAYWAEQGLERIGVGMTFFKP